MTATRLLLKILRQEYECLISIKRQCAAALNQNKQNLFHLLSQDRYQSDKEGLKAFLQDTFANPYYSASRGAWTVLLRTTLE